MEDFPGHVMAASDPLADPHRGVAVLIQGALPAPAAGRRFDAIAKDFLPEDHAINAGRTIIC